MEETILTGPLLDIENELFTPSDSTLLRVNPLEGTAQDEFSSINRRKKKHVKEACTRCKSWHKKCNGEFPCDNCINKKLECTYSEQRRRGPKPTSQYQETIEKLKSEVEFYKNQAYFSNSQLALRDKDECYPSITETAVSLLQETQLFCSSAVWGYYEALMPITELSKVLPERTELLQIQWTQNVSISLKYKWYSILGVGARQIGELEQADRFIEKAQELEKSLYDRVDEDVAHGLAYISYFYAMIANMQKASCHMSLANSMFEQLHATSKLKDVNTWGACLHGFMQMSNDPQYNIFCCNKVKQLKGMHKQFIFLANLQIISANILISERYSGIRFDTEYANSLLDEAEIYLGSLKQEDACYLTSSAFYNMSKARIYMMINKKEMALAYANKTHEIAFRVTKANTDILLITNVLKRLCIVFNQLGCLDKVFEIFAKLKQLSDIYPIASLMLLITSAQYNIDISGPQFQEWLLLQSPHIKDWSEKLVSSRRIQPADLSPTTSVSPLSDCPTESPESL